MQMKASRRSRATIFTLLLALVTVVGCYWLQGRHSQAAVASLDQVLVTKFAALRESLEAKAEFTPSTTMVAGRQVAGLRPTPTTSDSRPIAPRGLLPEEQ